MTGQALKYTVLKVTELAKSVSLPWIKIHFRLKSLLSGYSHFTVKRLLSA